MLDTSTFRSLESRVMNDASALTSNVLINKEGEWRCVWRVLAFYISLFLIASLLFALTGTLQEIIFQSGATPSSSQNASSSSALLAITVERSLLFISALVASAICAKMIERRTLASTGYKFHDGWSRDFFSGWVMGALTIAIAVAMAAAAGAMHFSTRQITIAEAARNFFILFFVLLIAAAFEEVFIRGFAFQALIRNTSPVAAVAITSAAFAALHLANTGASILSTVNTAIAGVWLGVAYIKTRSLWLATALHHSWNLVMVVVFGLPVSGILDYKNMAWLDGTGNSPVWISGGGYGPEGGVAATIALIVCTLLIARSRLFMASDEMKAAIIPGSAATQRISIFPKDSSRTS